MRTAKEEKMDRKMSISQCILGMMMVSVFVFFIFGEMLIPGENVSQKGVREVFDAEWVRVFPDGTRECVEVPSVCDAKVGERVVIETTLPDNQKVATLCTRATEQDMWVYVGDELRTEYTPDESRIFGRSSAIVYIFFDVYSEDAGKTLRIETVSRSSYTGVLNEIHIGDKSELWRHLWMEYTPGTIVSILMMVLGIVVVIYSCVLKYVYKKEMDILYLGIGIFLSALWLFVESKLRQFILPNAFVATSVGFFIIMLLPYPFFSYFNRVQKRRYQKYHLMLAYATMINFTISTALQVTNIKDFVDTMMISHAILIILIVLFIVTMILDVINKHIKDYYEVAIGFACFMMSGIVEIYLVYQEEAQNNGVMLSIGLIILLFTAGLKTGRDIINIDREKQTAIIAGEAKAQFLANMSHEIRTPINTVVGMNEMILRENEDESIREYAMNIKNASAMLLGLINDILDFSMIEAGKLIVTETTYNLAVMINDVISINTARIEKKNLEIGVEIDESMPSVLIGDEIRIKQIINNLMSNAIKYTEKGKVTFTVKGVRDNDEFYLLISVEDTGIGIKKEDVAVLFDSFMRLERKKNRSIQGTGLGLSITKQIVEHMKGTIEVESEYGKGTCFTVKLPQKIAKEEPMGNLSAAIKKEYALQDEIKKKEEENKLYAPDKNILVVDDNEMNLAVIKALLKRTEIKLDLATSGTQCIEMCKEKKYDLILMDHMMPEPDGIETLHLIKEDTEGKNIDTKVIVLTANAIKGVEDEYKKEGFVDYLAKPVTAGKLEEVISKHMNEK